MSGLRAVVAVSGLLSATVALAAAPVPVTSCGQVVERGTGILTADLDCSADSLAFGVELHKAKLLMNGHTITGAVIGVVCIDRCTILGPGTIIGNQTGIDQLATRPNRGNVTVKDVTVTGNSATGIAGDFVRVRTSTVSGNGGFVVGTNVVGGGILASRRVAIRDSAVDGNVTFGICSPERIIVVRSTAQTNGAAPGCDPDPACAACGDLVSSTKPLVSSTSTCDVSVNPPSGSWSVCGGN